MWPTAYTVLLRPHDAVTAAPGWAKRGLRGSGGHTPTTRGAIAGPGGARRFMRPGSYPGVTPTCQLTCQRAHKLFAGGGIRTLTPFRTRDFKSRASAISPLRHDHCGQFTGVGRMP